MKIKTGVNQSHEPQNNDRAVMQAYGFTKDSSENQIVTELFKMYKELTE